MYLCASMFSLWIHNVCHKECHFSRFESRTLNTSPKTTSERLLLYMFMTKTWCVSGLVNCIYLLCPEYAQRNKCMAVKTRKQFISHEWENLVIAMYTYIFKLEIGDRKATIGVVPTNMSRTQSGVCSNYVLERFSSFVLSGCVSMWPEWAVSFVVVFFFNELQRMFGKQRT